MPKIRLSTRGIQPVSMPNMRMGGGWNEGLAAGERVMRTKMVSAQMQYNAERDALRAFDAALVGAGRMKELIDRRAERDADEAATAWEAAMLTGMTGTVGKDGKRTGGIEQKTWADYEASGSSPIKDIGEIEKSFQSSDVYKNLSGMAREKFNRRVMARRAQYLGAANRIYDRNAQARTAFYDREADAIGERKMADAMMLDDAAFEKVEEEEIFRRTARAYRPYMANPEIVDAPGANPDHIRWKDEKAGFYFNKAFIDGRKKASLGRCVALAESAAMGEPKWVDGKLVTNDAQLKMAEEYARTLASPKTLTDGTKLPARITEEEAKRIAYKCQQARSQLDERVKKTIAAETANAQAKGDLATLEAAEAKMSALAKQFDKEPDRQTAALVAAKSLSEQADKRATFDIMNGLAEGKRLTLPDGKTSIFDPNTQARYVRCYPKALEEMGKLQKNGQKNNDTELQYAEAALDYLIEDGTHTSEEIERMKRKVYEKGNMLAKGRLLSPEDAEAFRMRWTKRNTKEQSAASVEFDRAFGVSFEMNPDGTVKKSVKTILGESEDYNPKYPGTGESVKLREYMKMRAAFVEQIKNLPPDADRVAQTRELISEFKGDWFKDRTAENIEDMVVRMIAINNDAAARIEEERLRAEEEERKRNIPVVSMEHPANRKEEDPLEFYKAAGSQYLRK